MIDRWSTASFGLSCAVAPSGALSCALPPSAALSGAAATPGRDTPAADDALSALLPLLPHEVSTSPVSRAEPARNIVLEQLPIMFPPSGVTACHVRRAPPW